MTTEDEKKVLSKLKTNFIYDLSKAVPNLLRKSSQDIRVKVSEILQTSDSQEMAEAKSFIDKSANIMGSDVVNTLIEAIEKY